MRIHTALLTALVALTAYPTIAMPIAETSDKTPNFLVFLTDDQRHDDISCAGNEILHTPNMDRIANDGIRFSNAFVTHSLCAPSRACFLTGKYSHAHGVINNNVEWPDQPIFTDYLREAGYNTVYIGKCHKGEKVLQNKFDHWLGFDGQGTYFRTRLSG